jgi:predicted nucleotidyltransferase
VLDADERVAAAALTNSYARGEVDGLSDLDILVAVRDEYVGEFVPARYRL